jgi:hypothetical protein
MKKFFTFKRTIIILIVLLAGIQLIPVDFKNPPIKPENDIIAVEKIDSVTAVILKDACYDCHSNETVYPWYSKVAPVSWWLYSHIEEGREEVNFSEWGTYKEKKKSAALTDSYEDIDDGEMPMWSYTLAHPKADLTDIQKERLMKIFETEGD